MREVLEVTIGTVLSGWTIVSIFMLLIQQQRFTLLTQEFEKYRKESVLWSLGDIYVEAERLKITIEEPVAQEILEKIIAEHNAWNGITWETIDGYLMDAVINGKADMHKDSRYLRIMQSRGRVVRVTPEDQQIEVIELKFSATPYREES